MRPIPMIDKIAYVIIREDLNSPIVQSQVVEVLCHINKNYSQTILLVWFFRVDYFFRSAGTIKSLRKMLEARGIHLVAIPFVSGRFPIPWYLIPFILPQWLIGLMWVWFKHGKPVLHCRSYHAALAGACFKMILPSKIIFDPRSPFPEENIAAGKWDKGSINYSFWKVAERWIAKKCDAIIATSRPFLMSFRALAPNSQIVLIPNNYSGVISSDLQTTAATDEDSTINTICYAGSLGHWNNPSFYLDFIEAIIVDKRYDCKAMFVVPTASVSVLEQCLLKRRIDTSKISVSSVSHENVLEEISGCTVGIQIMSQVDTRLSIKFVEYLAAGLPVIVSQNVRGAADIVETCGVGVILHDDFNNLCEVIAFIDDVSKNRLYWRQKCKRIAKQLFSTKVVSKQIIGLYQSLESSARDGD